MKFEINGRSFRIVEKSQEEIKKDNYDTSDGMYFGQTHYATSEIWLDKDLEFNQKRITLHHELMHLYKHVFITSESMQFTEEMLCDISANANYIINKIIDSYFDEKGE